MYSGYKCPECGDIRASVLNAHHCVKPYYIQLQNENNSLYNMENNKKTNTINLEDVVTNKKEHLLKERNALKEYLIAKFYMEDWHAVQDAGSDLRDIDNMLEGIDFVLDRVNK